MKGYVAAYRRTGVPAWQRTGAAAFHTPKGYQDLAQGAGFAEPWVIS